MKNFCLDLRGYVTKIINYKKKEMIPLTKEETRAHHIQRRCYICKKNLVMIKKKYHTIKDSEVLLMISPT